MLNSDIKTFSGLEPSRDPAFPFLEKQIVIDCNKVSAIKGMYATRVRGTEQIPNTNRSIFKTKIVEYCFVTCDGVNHMVVGSVKQLRMEIFQ